MECHVEACCSYSGLRFSLTNVPKPSFQRGASFKALPRDARHLGSLCQVHHFLGRQHELLGRILYLPQVSSRYAPSRRDQESLPQNSAICPSYGRCALPGSSGAQLHDSQGCLWLLWPKSLWVLQIEIQSGGPLCLILPRHYYEKPLRRQVRIWQIPASEIPESSRGWERTCWSLRGLYILSKKQTLANTICTHFPYLNKLQSLAKNNYNRGCPLSIY